VLAVTKKAFIAAGLATFVRLLAYQRAADSLTPDGLA
jgi:hypothetical protein